MSKIKIKNFGPIKEGFNENGNEWMDVKKVTIFIGNQGSGKSTVAKVISTLAWMEKAINRDEILGPKSLKEFQKYFQYQNLSGYFKESTTIEYYGEAYSIIYNSEEKPYTITTKNNSGKYIVPKIMYVPAERNFLSVIRNATGVRGLPEPLFDFAEELKRGQNEIKESEVELPINGVHYKYDKESDTSFIIGHDFNVNLLVASSGFQSIVPLFLVSRSLANIIRNGSEINPSNISVIQSIKMNEEIAKIMLDNKLTDTEKINMSNEIEAKFQNKAFINIVEEPEQNLFPTSQWQIVRSLLEFNNMSEGNKLLLTTHSPYIINCLSLAIQTNYLKNKIKSEDLLDRLNAIVSLKSTVQSSDVAIYQLDEETGTITKLPDYEGIPSDKNYLNMMIKKGNKLFDSLLELEEEI